MERNYQWINEDAKAVRPDRQSITGFLRESFLEAHCRIGCDPENEGKALYGHVRQMQAEFNGPLEQVRPEKLRNALSEASGSLMAAFEDYSFQRGVQVGAQLMLELLGKMPSMKD